MFAAAFAAGLVNSIAGGGTLLTFPLLIWLGLDPKVANATSTVALWPGLFGGVFGYRREMSDSSLILMRLGAVSVVGGGLGAWLLILTPSLTFARLVPFLILFATILFMLQGPVNRWLRVPSPTSGSQKSWWTIAIVVQFFSAIYGGYFGAGNGIWMLAAMGLLVNVASGGTAHVRAVPSTSGRSRDVRARESTGLDGAPGEANRDRSGRDGGTRRAGAGGGRRAAR